jgi:hypothetical protein
VTGLLTRDGLASIALHIVISQWEQQDITLIECGSSIKKLRPEHALVSVRLIENPILMYRTAYDHFASDCCDAEPDLDRLAAEPNHGC